ncbi:uncharacterized protein C9orf40 homolog [Mantella aurantiaca]
MDMTKRKCELQSLVTVLPPCKKPLCSQRCSTDTPGRKRKLAPESGPSVEDITPSPECERVLPSSPAHASPSPPCKKLRATECPQTPLPQYKCQKDEAFQEYNSFQYWRNPLPDIDFSELSDELCGVATSDIQEMDS